VSTVPEIESAIRELPVEDASAIAAWLQHYLDQQAHRPPGKNLEEDRLDHKPLALRERVLPVQLLDRGAYAVRGFARRLRSQPRSTAEWMKELREGER
jgi:hypothetical protein